VPTAIAEQILSLVSPGVPANETWNRDKPS
jgi:hypothetical protein